MSNNRSLTSLKLVVFALLATVVSTGLLSAGDYSGKFTLPLEAKWGRAILPAGEYEFKINTDVAPFTLKVSGKDGTASRHSCPD